MNHPRRFKALIYFLFIALAAWSFNTVVASGGDPVVATQAWPMIESGALLVDVRSVEEFEAGHLEGAIHIPWDQMEDLVAAIGDDKQRQVVFYCRTGNRAGKSIKQLETMGYTNIFNATGLEALKETRP